MFNYLIRFSLRHRLSVVAAAALLMVFGGYQIFRLPVDVLPNLNRPRVAVMTESPGLAPEEVETLVTMPLESVLNGATGVLAVRSTSTVGLSMITVEFDWGTDVYEARQIVGERLALASTHLPRGITPQMTPISSVMGQIMVLGLYSRPSEETLLFGFDFQGELEDLFEETTPGRQLRHEFAAHEKPLSTKARIRPGTTDGRWLLVDPTVDRWCELVSRKGKVEVHETTSPMALRTIADWEIRKQLLTIGGVAEVFVMGGDRKQFQVSVLPDALQKYGVTLHEVEEALRKSNENVTGGYLSEQGSDEYLVRALGRIESIEDLKILVVKPLAENSVLLQHVARIEEAAQVKRGDSAAYVREPDGSFSGGPAVILTVEKQPNMGTGELTEAIHKRLKEIKADLKPDIRVVSLYQQQDFIDLAISNVIEALWIGGLLVVIILFLFLVNVRATVITLVAMPLSIVVTCLVFARFGLSINTMTLGGLAVAIGELVDDAIVDVENIFRRLRENARSESPRSAIRVIYEASCEIRNSIVFGTFIVCLVFLPLFSLGGIEGRLFAPLGVAYIVSILSSLAISLTVTPVLAYWLLPGIAARRKSQEGLLMQVMKKLAGGTIRFSLAFPKMVITMAMLVVVLSVGVFFALDREFMPAFNEGAVQLNVDLMPGKSLDTSVAIAGRVAEELQQVEGVRAIVRKTGRAELDEHAIPVNTTEFICSLDSDSPRSQKEIAQDLDAIIAAENIPGTAAFSDQPLQHLIAHLRSGSRAKIAIKLKGDRLDVLRTRAGRIVSAIEDVEDTGRIRIDPIQVDVPQLRIELDRMELAQAGLTPSDVTELIETAMHGRVVTEVMRDQRIVDVTVRMDQSYRESIEALRHLVIRVPSGGTVPLESVATIDRSARGPARIDHEAGRRQVIVQANPRERGAVEVKDDIERSLAPIRDELTEGNYELTISGLFESEQEAAFWIGWLSVLSLIGIFIVLYTMFRSANLALQVMCALPMALIGAVAAISITGQDRTIPCLVGLISLCGIASRNGILLLDHYMHLVRYEGETWSREMLIRAGRDRVAPVLMTALTSALGLVPLILASGEPGKEILYPIATVVVGGLITSTMMEFLVRPALFWTFGRQAAQAALQRRKAEKTALEAPAVLSRNPTAFVGGLPEGEKEIDYDD